MADAIRLPLELFYEREARHPNKRYMVQPLGGGQLLELSWADVGEQARRVANWLRSRELPPGSRIAIISKNCAHWIVADLGIWMAGYVSVPLYPNLTAGSMRQVLEHSEAALAFVGKLDDWASMAPGLPESSWARGMVLLCWWGYASPSECFAWAAVSALQAGSQSGSPGGCAWVEWA